MRRLRRGACGVSYPCRSRRVTSNVLQQVLVSEISIPYEVFQCKAYRGKKIRSPLSHVPLSEAQHWTLLDLEGRTYDLGFLGGRCRFKKPVLSWMMKRGFWSVVLVLVADVRFSNAMSMAVYSPFSGGLSASMSYSTPNSRC